MSNSLSTSRRKRLLAAVASIAIAGSLGFGAVTTGTVPVFAEAVRVEAPQAPGFAEVVEHVSPAVVSVRVKSAVQTTSDGGDTMQLPRGFEDLPDDHPMKRFFREFRGFGDERGDNSQRRNRRPGDGAPGNPGSQPTLTPGRAPPPPP